MAQGIRCFSPGSRSRERIRHASLVHVVPRGARPRGSGPARRPCRRPDANDRRPGRDPNRQLGPSDARRVWRAGDGIDPAGDVQPSRGGRDLSRHDQGGLHHRCELRQGGAARPPSRPQLEPAGDGDDGGRQPRLPGRRAVGRHRARVRHAAEPQRHPQRPEGHARCRRLRRAWPHRPPGQRRHRRAARRGDLFLCPQPRPVPRRVD